MNTLVSGFVLAQAANASGSMFTTLIMFGAIFVIFYFLIIRPQSKKQKEAQKMIAAMKKGDKVVTIGGLHAIVQSVKEGTVILKADDNVKLEFSKSAIQAVTAKSEEKSEQSDAGSDEEKK